MKHHAPGTDGGEPPARRLDRTRLAILEHVARREQRHAGAHAHHEPDPDHALGAEALPGDHAAAVQRPRAGGAGGWFGGTRDHIDAWWRHHPAHMAVDLARPALSSYARRKPVQFLAVAAGAGAVLMLMRPWKLISVGGVAVALLKSPQVLGLVMGALSRGHNPPDDQAAPPG